VHVRDVEALEVVVAVERPVRLDQVLSRARGVEHRAVERQEAAALADVRGEVVERTRGRERGEQELAQLAERERLQVVGRAREALDAVELGHGEEPAVEREAPAVVAAAQELLHARLLADDRAAVRAHVRDAVHAVVAIAREQQWLVERALEQ
jgi:hypothetical protein